MAAFRFLEKYSDFFAACPSFSGYSVARCCHFGMISPETTTFLPTNPHNEKGRNLMELLRKC